jgi:hypothetical protein
LKKNILIYSDIAGGHHETYLQVLTETFLKLNVNLYIVAPNSQHLMDTASVTYVDMGKVESSKKDIISKYLEMNRICKQLGSKGNIKIDLVFYAWLDYFTSKYNGILIYLLSFILRKPSWGGIYFHPVLHRNRYDSYKFRVRRFLKEIAFRSKNCKVVAVLDEGVQNSLKKTLGNKICSLPDFTNIEKTNNSTLARELSIFAGGRKILMVAGALSERKNILPLLKFALENTDNGHFCFAFIGELRENSFPNAKLEEVYSSVEILRKRGDCFFYLQRIDDERVLNELISLCGVLLLLYEDFRHSSNLMTKAAYFQVPVIVKPGFLMAERVSKYGTGIVWDSSKNTLLDTIKRALEIEPNEKYNDYYMLNTTEVLQRVLMNILNKME